MVIHNAGDTNDSSTPGGAEGRAGRRRWLLLIYRVPQEPAARRAYVWRQLKQLGAVYLQKAAAVLPDREETREALEALAVRIRGEYEGEASLLETTSPDPEWERDLVGRFDGARDAEYGEVAENVERFEDEIRRERRKGRFGFAQLEDIESEWEKLERWHGRVRARDFFGAPGGAGAEEALARGRMEREGFAKEVYDHEGVHADEEDETERTDGPSS